MILQSQLGRCARRHGKRLAGPRQVMPASAVMSTWVTACPAYRLGQRPSVIARTPVFRVARRTTAKKAAKDAAKRPEHYFAPLCVGKTTFPQVTKNPAAPQDQRGTAGSVTMTAAGGRHRFPAYKPNTYNTVALRWSLSSGVARSFVREVALGPDAIATYWRPPTSNVMGGAPNPAPRLIFHR